MSTLSSADALLDVLKVVVSSDGDAEEVSNESIVRSSSPPSPAAPGIVVSRSARLATILGIVLLFAATLFAWEELRIKSDSGVRQAYIVPPPAHPSEVPLEPPQHSSQERILDAQPQPQQQVVEKVVIRMEDHSTKLDHTQLIDEELSCASSTSPITQCSFAWDSTASLSDPDGATAPAAAKIDPTTPGTTPSSSPIRPQDFYTFQAGIHMTEEGPGALVRIRMRDLCCTVSPGSQLPLSYFRITAVGASQTGSNPPLALGAAPAALGRGHQPIVKAKQQWSQDSNLSHVDEERVLQTFLLLPDPGHYEIRVRLLHFNSSIEMISEKYQERSWSYNERPGTWVNGLLKNAKGDQSTRLFVPLEAAMQSPAFKDRSKLSLCGADTAEEYDRVKSGKGHISKFPLAGRWVLSNAALHELVAEQSQREVNNDRIRLDSFLWDIDFTDRSAQWLVEHSRYHPYDCYLDQSVSYGGALERVRWLHLTGDSNIRNQFFTLCGMANGTATFADPKVTPRKMDPPHLCIGPNSSKQSSPKWVVSYTNWFWLKPQTLEPSFNFRERCKQYEPGNPRGIFRGWPGCEQLPDFIQRMDGPGATYFGWGSHAAEFGYHPSLQSVFETDQTFAMPFFKSHPTLFALTTANAPGMIPDKFGPQQRIRNNERVYGSNLHLTQAVQNQSPAYSSRASPNNNWYPVFDLFSPSHAALESLLGDAVHYRQFFYEQGVNWLMHYLMHAPNFAAASAAAASDSEKQQK